MEKKMKKIAYIAAALAVLAGCSKAELAPESVATGAHDIAVSVKVATGATRSSFDGESYIKFDKGDAFYAGVAKASAPTTAIKVASKQGDAASEYYSLFTIADAEATEPSFNGSLYSIVDADFAGSYLLYGIFPSSKASASSDLTKWSFTLDASQASTQTSWSGKADAMVIKPTSISTATNTHDDKYGEYTTTNEGEKVEFAHVFGFGKINFAGIPDEYKDLVVKSIKIETTDSKYITGKYTIDVTKEVDEITPVEGASYNMNNYISLTGDGSTTIGDYTAWFVANPGTYNVKITVATAKADFIFEREGLEIKRGEIAAPTVNYKAADTTVSHDVALADGENWIQDHFTYSTYISSSSREREWGPSGKKMTFSLSYPGSVNDNYGSSITYAYPLYVQALAYQNVTGGVVELRSDAAFSGVSLVKVNCGIYSKDVTGDLCVCFVNGADTTKLGTVTLTGDNTNTNGKNCFFENPTKKSGQLVIKANKFSDTNCRPYVGLISLNPEPEIEVDTTPISVSIDGTSGTLSCIAYAASADPTVSVSADAASWLSASYDASDKTISYTVAANTGAKRSGTITVSAKGTSETSEQIKVTQASATAKEFTVKLTAADMYTVLHQIVEDEGITSNYTYAAASKTVTATSTDGLSTKEVTFSTQSIAPYRATETSFTLKSSSGFDSSELGEITKVVVESAAKFSDSSWADIEIYFSADGASWTRAKTTDGYTFAAESRTEGGYTNTVTNIPDNYTMVRLYGSYSIPVVYSIEVTFLAD